MSFCRFAHSGDQTSKVTCKSWTPGILNSCSYGQNCKFLHAGGGRPSDPPQVFSASATTHSFGTVSQLNTAFPSLNSAVSNPFGNSFNVGQSAPNIPQWSGQQAQQGPWMGQQTSGFGNSGIQNVGFSSSTNVSTSNGWAQSTHPMPGFPNNFNQPQVFLSSTTAPSSVSAFGNSSSIQFPSSAWNAAAQSSTVVAPAPGVGASMAVQFPSTSGTTALIPGTTSALIGKVWITFAFAASLTVVTGAGGNSGAAGPQGSQSTDQSKPPVPVKNYFK